jgi:N-acetyl-anhydromuramyl-L-alanine amidase AmpD
MSATKSHNLLFALVFASAGITSCQSLDGIIPSFLTNDFKTQSRNEIGTGAVESQSELKPQPPSAINICSKKLAIPKEDIQQADPSNYGNRDQYDYLGKPLSSKPRFIVVHETVMGEKDTISLFKTHHPNDANQVSYHMVIARDGRLIRVVPDEKRAYGAGMSHFMGSTLKAKKNSAGSINNVALHISLVSPPGFEQTDSHTGYTPSQYSSLAKQVLKWQMQYGIPMSRVTTHYAVDRSHSRYDPRSFHWDKFDKVHIGLTSICKLKEFAHPTT